MARPIIKKVEEAPAGEGAPLWVITFSDMVALLMCFFITLFSLSSIKKDKFVLVASAIRGYFGAHGEESSKLKDVGKNSDTFMQSFKDFLKRQSTDDRNEDVGRGLTGYDGGDRVKVRKVREGLQVTLGDKQLFAEGSAELRLKDPGVRESLDYLAKELVGYRFVIRIDGYASPTEFGRIVDPSIHDLWELSMKRARNVMEYLAHGTQKEYQITERRFKLGANGANNGVKDDKGREVASENRSVEIIVTEQRVFFEGEKEPVQ